MDNATPIPWPKLVIPTIAIVACTYALWYMFHWWYVAFMLVLVLIVCVKGVKG